MTSSDDTARVLSTSPGDDRVNNESAETAQRNDVLIVSGQLIGAVERAVTAFGADFVSLFRTARLELADDYSFFDPFSTRFQYANSVVTLPESAPVNGYVTGVSEALRRVVARVATGERVRRVSERVAIELAMVARAQRDLLQRTGFVDKLDRIAGTKVI